ncbi:MAG: hypothetical protein RLZZ628_2141 [Bacteroidota bacterium]|jgi:hypothetical protein
MRLIYRILSSYKNSKKNIEIVFSDPQYHLLGACLSEYSWHEDKISLVKQQLEYVTFLKKWIKAKGKNQDHLLIKWAKKRAGYSEDQPILLEYPNIGYELGKLFNLIPVSDLNQAVVDIRPSDNKIILINHWDIDPSDDKLYKSQPLILDISFFLKGMEWWIKERQKLWDISTPDIIDGVLDI